MTFIRKNTLPKGAYLLLKDNQKTPQGFDYASSLNEFTPDFIGDNIIKSVSEYTPIDFFSQTQEDGVHRISVRIEVESGHVDGTVEAVHRRARKGTGVYRIPLSFGVLNTVDGAGDGLPHPENVYFSVGVMSTSEGDDIGSYSDLASAKASFDTSLAYFNFSLSDSGIYGALNINHAQLVLTEQGEVKQSVSVIGSPSFVGLHYGDGTALQVALLVDLDNRRIAVEYQKSIYAGATEYYYVLSDWVDMRTDWPYSIRSHFYLKMYAESRMKGDINITDSFTDEMSSNQRVKTDGYFMKQSPMLVIKK